MTNNAYGDEAGHGRRRRRSRLMVSAPNASRRRSSRHWRWGTGAVAAVALATTVSACGGVPASSKAAVSPGSGAHAKPAAPFVITEGSWGSTWSTNPFNSSFLSWFNDFALMPLASAVPPKFGVYDPQLATSWKASPTEITIDLRKRVRWQDGNSVTATDVVDTLLLQGTDGNAMWEQISGVKATGPYQVVVDLKQGSNSATVLSDLFGVYIVPASQYARFVSPTLQKDLISYWSAEATDPAAANTTPRAKFIDNTFKKLASFSPKPFIGDGPFELVNGNPNQILMRKSPTYWDASAIAVPRVEFEGFGSNNEQYPAISHHEVTLSGVAAPYAVVQSLIKTPGVHYTTANSYGQEGFYFNDRLAPLNNLDVRKALAYLINRETLLAGQDGGHTPYRWVRHPDGLLGAVAHQWLSSRQISSLNSYSYSPAKAAQLLGKAGLHKKGSTWYLPNGKPFTLSVDGPSGWSGPTVGITIIAHDLSSFGIPTTASAVEQPGFWTFQQQGRFQIDWGWVGTGGLDPLADIDSVLGHINFSTSGTYKGDPGIGFGPAGKVPGLGRVDIPATLSAETASTGPGEKMAELTWDWARFVNQQVPFIGYGNKYGQLWYTTTAYTHWPSKSSPLWSLTGYNFYGGLVKMMQDGFLRPVR